MKKRKRLLIFSAFLMFSTMMWLLIRLSAEYTVTYNLPVTFVQIPPEIWVRAEDRNHDLRIVITATGFKQLRASFIMQRNKRGLPVSLEELPWRKQNRRNFYIRTASMSYLVAGSLGIAENELSMVEQEIIFSAESTVQKKVPLYFASPLHFRQGFGQYGKVRLDPSAVLVSGPAAVLDTLQALPVISSTSKDLYTNVSGQASIQCDENLLHPEISTVDFSLEVQQFTEKVIPLTIKKPQKPVLKLFPEKVRLTLRVALKDFDNISFDSVAVVLDTTGLKKNVQFLRLQAIIREKEVQLIEINPNRVEYLIIKP